MRACVHIYSMMSMHEEAVALALQVMSLQMPLTMPCFITILSCHFYWNLCNCCEDLDLEQYSTLMKFILELGTLAYYINTQICKTSLSLSLSHSHFFGLFGYGLLLLSLSTCVLF